MAEEVSIEGDVMEDHLKFEQGTIDGDTMVIIQDGDEATGHFAIEQGISLQGEGGESIQMSAADLGEAGYTITTGDNGETYISSADGRFHTQVNTEEQPLIYNTEDGEQLVLQDAAMAHDPTAEQMIISADSPEPEAVMPEALSPARSIVIQHMDIGHPIARLQELLEKKLDCNLDQYDFYLQDNLLLEKNKNLVSQCVQGSGLVQINVEVKQAEGVNERPRLNIVDILKPTEDVCEELLAEQQAAVQQAPVRAPKAKQKVVIPFVEENENVTRWIVDQAYRREQERLNIPQDPNHWDESHVQHWITWAINEFKLQNVQPETFANLTGKDLCEMKHDEFSKLVMNDRRDIFWTHLELLRKCRFVAVIQQPTPNAITTVTVPSSDPLAQNSTQSQHRISRQPASKPRSVFLGSDRIAPGNRTGNNGQIQLWQFLLELLTDKDCRESIHWVGDDGEFKLANPEMVAQMWGQRKNKTTMNYEKLSRALRYYYDGDMIAKVHGKRFVYKFVCDLRMLLGYTAGELSRLVNECSVRQISSLHDAINTTRPNVVSSPHANRRRTAGAAGLDGHVIIPHKSRQIRQAVASIPMD